MPASSLIRLSNRTKSRGQHLYWDRVGEDGFPYRGGHAPIMPNEEYESRVVRVADFRNAFFDVMKPEDNRHYCDIMECCANGWFRLWHMERFWRGTTSHYVEWFEYYMEDGTRTPFAAGSGGLMEMFQNGFPNSFGTS